MLFLSRRGAKARVLARLAALGIAFGAVALAGSALTVEQGCGGKADTAKSPDPIVIGASFGLTNGLAGTSGPLRDALRVAEGQINAAGGLLGRPVVFDIVDDASDEDALVTKVAQDFVAKNVVAVIGPVSSGQVVKVAKIYADAQIIELTATATSTELTNLQPAGDRWLFRTTPADDFQGAAVMAFAQRTPRGLGDAGAPAGGDGGIPATCSKLAVVHIDNSYGNSMSDVIQNNWKKRSGQDVLVRKKVAVDLAGSYQDVVAQVMTAPGGPPQCLALITYDDVAAQFVRDFKAHPLYPSLAANGFFFIGTDGVYTDLFLKYGLANQSDPTSANVAEGVTGTNPDTQPGTPEYNQFKTLFSSYFPLNGKEAPSFAANAYDAAMLIALAIQKAGTVTDRVAVRNALLAVATPPGKVYSPGQLGDAFQALQSGQDIDYKGASGDVDVEANGNVKAGFIIWQAYKTPEKKYDYQTIGRFGLQDLGQIQ